MVLIIMHPCKSDWLFSIDVDTASFFHQIYNSYNVIPSWYIIQDVIFRLNIFFKQQQNIQNKKIIHLTYNLNFQKTNHTFYDSLLSENKSKIVLLLKWLLKEFAILFDDVLYIDTISTLNFISSVFVETYLAC